MEESRTHKTLKNIFYGACCQASSLLLTFIGRTVFIKTLGAEFLGINGLFSDVLTMLSMADLGFNTAMIYSFYKPLAEKDYDKIAALIHFYKKIYNIIAMTVAVIGLLLVPFLQYIVNLDSTMPHLKIYYIFFLANTVISYLFVYKTSIITADQKGYIISKYQMLVNMCRTFFQIISLVVLKNYFIYLFIQVLATFFNNFIASRKANKLYPEIKSTNLELVNEEKKEIFENLKSIFIYKASSVFMNGTDNTIISILVGTIWVGYYSNYNIVTNAVNLFINIIYSSATASIGNAVITENSSKRYRIFQSMQTISFVLSTFTTVCLSLILSDLIYVWLGSEYVLNNLILISILINFYLSIALRPILAYREATGLYRQTKYIMIIAAIENIVFSIALCKVIGMSGVLLASAISRLTTYFWYEPKLLFSQYFEERVRKYYIVLIKNILVTIAIILVLTKLFSGLVITSWIILSVKTVIVAFITLIAIIVFYRKSEGFNMLENRVLSIWRNYKK
jgi:O-antigen/teichoic acid export membrane protein